ncbi:hypothetical protein SUDANB121_01849 [Nocardiopsis dassonvillei]|uniref:hypothetical protein n=1 Tax=Nocardiopsis dassonvillei TaxID=2014 RepID=UPI003F56A438
MSPPPRGHRVARRSIALAVYVLAVALTLALAAALLREGAEMIRLTWEYAAHRSG